LLTFCAELLSVLTLSEIDLTFGLDGFGFLVEWDSFGIYIDGSIRSREELCGFSYAMMGAEVPLLRF
jgi:hypothetical protein